MKPGFELFDHTADLGVNVRADTLEAIVPPAIAGLYAAVGDLVPGDRQPAVRVELTGGDRAELLRDLLAEMLFAFETEQRIAADVVVHSFTDQALAVDICWARVDLSASRLQREVKAVTYHELSVEPGSAGWMARFIVDI